MHKEKWERIKELNKNKPTGAARVFNVLLVLLQPLIPHEFQDRARKT